jgi:hypothetical protein
MTPGWHNVRNGLSANGHRRPRLIGHNLLIMVGAALFLWIVVVTIATVVLR